MPLAFTSVMNALTGADITEQVPINTNSASLHHDVACVHLYSTYCNQFIAPLVWRLLPSEAKLGGKVVLLIETIQGASWIVSINKTTLPPSLSAPADSDILKFIINAFAARGRSRRDSTWKIHC